jgi:phosphohistidine phosphatase SixA
MIRKLLIVGASLCGLPLAALLAAVPAAADEAGWDALRHGAIALIRHANAPGGGDPPGMRLGDCGTQRNLDARGRAQAERIGEAFRSRGVAIGGVLTSHWCRAVDTAALAFPGLGRTSAAFDSFFADRSRSGPQTQAAAAILTAWTGPGTLVAVTHQVNITALTDVLPASGEVIVVRMRGGKVEVVARISP